MPTLSQLRQTLDGAGELYHVLPLQGDACALITQRGARVLGLFPTPDADNLLWTNDAALESVESFQQFVAEGGWNLGGERCWIAPEIQYNVRDRSDFWGTLSVPSAIDPGSYRMDVSGAAVTFQQQISLSAYNTATGTKQLDVRRTVRPIANPLRAYDTLLRGVIYAGYEQTATLAELNDAPILSEIWNLVQVNAGGHLIIPCAPEIRASDYCGDVPDKARAVCFGDVPHLRLTITGQRQYKIGYQATSMTGRMAYHHRLPDGRDYLLVRSFFNNPSSIYAEEPPDQPGATGHSVHVYNDGGQFGAGGVGFGEMECSGQTIGGRSGRSGSSDTFLLWAYVGAPEAIRRIVYLLLGVKL
ncbi:MAG: hypothetical protein HZC41_05500 [Chloroflexi bacterium]|nr:hypothetical protein [Chloroflexota bacterium]